jgi:hypothetical protein
MAGRVDTTSIQPTGVDYLVDFLVWVQRTKAHLFGLLKG